MDWTKSRVLITGGASFIGSTLADALARRGAPIRVVDDLSSGRREYLERWIERGAVEFIEGDLRDPLLTARAVRGISHVFHLAAAHGGRGYVDLHNVECSGNLVLDGVVFQEAVSAGVQKLIFASSGCVYPNSIQGDPSEERYLREEDVGPPYDADNMYGWAKLMAELTLRHYAQQGLVQAVSCRYFTVYGPKAKEDHAIMALIARAVIGQDPYEVWGTGQQVRNWTYVDDIVSGTILAAEHIGDGSAVNLGTEERIRVIDAVNRILERFGHRPQLNLRPEMPTGPYNRVASNRRAGELLGWKPATTFAEGLERTIEWYVRARGIGQARERVERGLMGELGLEAS